MRASTRVGYRKVELDPAARTVRLLEPGMKLDLGGIAKGFAADEALRVLERTGSRAPWSPRPAISPWATPRPTSQAGRSRSRPLRTASGARGPDPTVSLVRSNISTSGDAEQFVEIGGVRYSHILDPHTGLGVVGRSVPPWWPATARPPNVWPRSCRSSARAGPADRRGDSTGPPPSTCTWPTTDRFSRLRRSAGPKCPEYRPE